MTKYEWESELRKNIHRLPDEEIRKVLEYYGELFADKAERGLSETEIVAQFGNPVDVADKILSEYEGELKPAEPVAVPPAQQSKKLSESEPPVREPVQTPPVREPVHTPPAQPAPQPEHNCRYHRNNRFKNGQPQQSERRTASGANAQSRVTGFQADRFILFVLLNVFTGFTFFIVVCVVWIVALALTFAGGAMAIGGIAGALVSLVQTCMGNGLSGLAQIGVCIALCGVGVLLLVGFITIIKLLIKASVKLFTVIRDWICPNKNETSGQPGVEV